MLNRIRHSLYILVITQLLFFGQACGESKLSILFLGDSLTAGFGVGEDKAYPALLGKKLDQAKIINAGVSGDTTAGGLRRLNWLMNQQIDILVLALGSNDALRGFPPQTSKENLSQIILNFQKRFPGSKILLTGQKAPPSMGKNYSEEFDQIFPALAKDHSLDFMPFLLKDVAGEKELNLPDRIHPNESGQQLIANNLFSHLRALLEKPGKGA